MNNNPYCNSSSDLINGSIYIDRARQMLCSSGPGSEAGKRGRRERLPRLFRQACCAQLLASQLPPGFHNKPYCAAQTVPTSCVLPLGGRNAANEAGLSSDLFDDRES